MVAKKPEDLNSVTTILSDRIKGATRLALLGHRGRSVNVFFNYDHESSFNAIFNHSKWLTVIDLRGLASDFTPAFRSNRCLKFYWDGREVNCKIKRKSCRKGGKKMKKIWMALGSVVLVLFFIFAWGVSTSNTLVDLDEGVKEKWAQVENVYQRRMDLIPNLVRTVKGYAQHESQVLEKVTQARSQVGQVRVNQLDDLKKYEQAQAQLSQALSRLMVVVERYPELKADRSFLELQSQLEGTENRISVERMRFNEAARYYNSYLKRFPQSLVASLRGFHERLYFEADPSARVAPQVEF